MQVVLVPTIILFSAAAIFSACQGRRPDTSTAAHVGAPSATNADQRVAVRDGVPVYEFGPQQLTKPNTTLNKGVLVRAVQKRFGYTLVESAEGNRLGWVANEDLGVAPPEPTPAQPVAVDNTVPIPAPVGMAPAEGLPQGANENPAIVAPPNVQTPNNLPGQKPSSVGSPEKSSFPIIAP
jgi:hypothetical protein